MSAKQKMCTVVDLPTAILASLFAPLMLAGLPNHFPLLTMMWMKCIIHIHIFMEGLVLKERQLVLKSMYNTSYCHVGKSLLTSFVFTATKSNTSKLQFDLKLWTI